MERINSIVEKIKKSGAKRIAARGIKRKDKEKYIFILAFGLNIILVEGKSKDELMEKLDKKVEKVLRKETNPIKAVNNSIKVMKKANKLGVLPILKDVVADMAGDGK